MEPIQEEEERKGDEEDEDLQTQSDEETKRVMGDDQSEEDDSGVLRVMRPRRVSRYSQEKFPQLQVSINQQRDLSSQAMSSHDEAETPKPPRITYSKRSTSGELRIKVGPSFFFRVIICQHAARISS